MPRALSQPVLVVFAVGVAILLWLDARRPFLVTAQLRWLVGATALLAIAMILALAGVPATRGDTLARALLLAVCVVGTLVLIRRLRRS